MSYDFSSVHIDLPVRLSENIIDWGKHHIPDNTLFKNPKDPSFGREDEIHITILYGIHSEFPDQSVAVLKKENPINITLGEINLFTSSKLFDVVYIKVISEDLERLNEKLKNKISYTNCYETYVPHVTIAYVKKDMGWDLKDHQEFADIDFTSENYVFSSKKGIRWQQNFKTV